MGTETLKPEVVDAVCKNYRDPGAPECAKAPDPKYTMRFDDIGKPPIYWCSVCGPEASAMDKALNRAFAAGGQKFVDKFQKAMDDHPCKHGN